ncbi:TRAFs-binding domain-containing protein [Photobacterium damselae]|uniref:TRAFs-binding domain-containing protein n=1 Tax=Photobacterium damselae TaxID=38293 RepID=UPI0040681157
MHSNQKICFVIMGFGKKTDYSTGKTFDLDQTYKNIIQPAVENAGYLCIRADEIQDPGLIDKSMYALLMHADLVVADISTFNPNAIYELGIRHAVKPCTTIILKEEGGKINFDLDHTRIFHYKHLGEDIGADEAKRCQVELISLIEKATQNAFIDSPLYNFINDIQPPTLPAAEYARIIGDLAEKGNHIFAITEKAKTLMAEGQFIDATKLWKRASEMAPTEDYFVQQQALATYKSKSPSETIALSDALRIIEKLSHNGETNDPETLGLTGAIYKRMWLNNNDRECLRRAKNFYEKGFQISSDYYTGENYALCLDMLSASETDDDERIYFRVAAKKTRQRITDILLDIISEEPDSKYKWAYATLSNCFYALDNHSEGDKYEQIFRSMTDIQWELETFDEGKKKMMELMA